VYDILVSLAREWVRKRGTRKLGMKALFERARWELSFETDDAEFLLNNTWAPWFARLIAIQEADLRDVFELRPSEADDWAPRDDGPSNIAGQRLKATEPPTFTPLTQKRFPVAPSKAPIQWLPIFLPRACQSWFAHPLPPA
jgi:hypothetical protein